MKDQANTYDAPLQHRIDRKSSAGFRGSAPHHYCPQSSHCARSTASRLGCGACRAAVNICVAAANCNGSVVAWFKAKGLVIPLSTLALMDSSAKQANVSKQVLMLVILQYMLLWVHVADGGRLALARESAPARFLLVFLGHMPLVLFHCASSGH